MLLLLNLSKYLIIFEVSFLLQGGRNMRRLVIIVAAVVCLGLVAFGVYSLFPRPSVSSQLKSMGYTFDLVSVPNSEYMLPVWKKSITEDNSVWIEITLTSALSGDIDTIRLFQGTNLTFVCRPIKSDIADDVESAVEAIKNVYYQMHVGKLAITQNSNGKAEAKTDLLVCTE